MLIVCGNWGVGGRESISWELCAGVESEENEEEEVVVKWRSNNKDYLVDK